MPYFKNIDICILKIKMKVKNTSIKVKVCANEVKLVRKFVYIYIYSLICAYVQNVMYTYVCI